MPCWRADSAVRFDQLAGTLAQVIEALERVANTFAPPAAAANASASAIVALLTEHAALEAAINRLDFVAALLETRR